MQEIDWNQRMKVWDELITEVRAELDAEEKGD